MELAAQADTAAVWHKFFTEWPSELPRRGVLVTSLEEQIPFEGFMTSETMLLVDRRAPDTSGARKVIVPYGHVAAYKVTDVLRGAQFQAAGFSGKLKDM